MTLEEFEKATEAELRQKANGCFETLTAHRTRDVALLEAKFYLDEIERREHAKEHKYHVWISWRDLILELVVIALIGGEIYFGHKSGKEQYDALMALKAGADQTVLNLKAVNDSQAQLLDTIKSEMEVLKHTQTTLSTQLETAERQQRLISRLLTLQENSYAEQQSAPKIVLRAQSYQPSGQTAYSIIKLERQGSLIRFVGMEPVNGLSTVDLFFHLRNVGTASLRNLQILPRFSPRVMFQCIGYPSLILIGDSGNDCSDPLSRIPTIEPTGDNVNLPVPNNMSSGADFNFKIRVLVPTDVDRFDMNLIFIADNLSPILYRTQFLHWFPPKN